jgi:response regulator NasT
MTENGKQLRVMVVAGCRDRALLVERPLAAHGHPIVARLRSGVGLREEVARLVPDIVIIVVDSLDRDLLEGILAVDRDHPCPIVVFANAPDAETIETAVRAGVSAYVVDGLCEARVMPILAVALARFREVQALRRELAEAKAKLAERKLVERAKGLLMQQSRLDEHAAYAAIRKMAMDRNLRMADLARSLIAASELLTPPAEPRGAARPRQVP